MKNSWAHVIDWTLKTEYKQSSIISRLEIILGTNISHQFLLYAGTGEFNQICIIE